MMDGKKAIHFFMKLSRISLQICGVWPDPEKNNILAFFHYALMAGWLFFAILVVQFIQLIIVWGDVDAMSDIMAFGLLFYAVAFAKMTCLWYYRKNLMKLLSYMIQDWDNTTSKKEYNIMTKYGHFSKKVSGYFVLIIFVATWTRFIQMCFVNSSVFFRNNPNSTRLLTMELYVPFDYNYFPAFEFVYMANYLAAFIGNISNTGTDALFFQIGFHFVAQFQILHLNIDNLVTEHGNKFLSRDFDKKLCSIIQKHEDINRCLETIEDTFSVMLLIQFLVHSILFCLQGYRLIQFVTYPQTKTLFLEEMFVVEYIMYVLSISWIYCYVSEALENESIALGQSAYDCKWFYLSPGRMRNLLFIIQRCRKPVQITAAKFFVMNLEKFGNILKTSLGYLSLLLTMKQNQIG